ncbi:MULTISPECIES: hypothetical protein [unclassified Campylobacter]|uniref:hypothetical protein n=1 Tax=unclassified Campylobacter TaxID=2593542 RepID=UPI00115F57B6|nr:MULTISPECIES: hypothetical protein [unclassified Campylobacter]NDJ27308.1 hypothetical protein [Campylobacter sp. MIT 19-121]
MAFMSFEPFFVAQNELIFFHIKELQKKKTSKYCLYKLKDERDELEYIGVLDELFKQNDELILAKRRNKIILFKNFTQNTDNFKEANLRSLLFLILCFVASAVFLVFCFMNDFQMIDIGFFVIFSLAFILSLNNFLKIIKQISMLKMTKKEEIQNFIDNSS